MTTWLKYSQNGRYRCSISSVMKSGEQFNGRTSKIKAFSGVLYLFAFLVCVSMIDGSCFLRVFQVPETDRKMADQKSFRVPTFNMKDKSYESYKFELECWTKMTKLEPKRQAGEILFGLPAKDEFNTREYIISKMTPDEIAADDGSGITSLIKHMDNLLRKDDLGRLWNRYIQFDSVKRTTQTIDEYISEFGIKYSELSKDDNVKLPSAILALMLIRRANISSNDVKLALTGLDYSKKDSLYEQSILALRKYAGDTFGNNYSTSCGGLFSEPTPPMQIKQEVMQADAYYGGSEQTGFRGGSFRARGRGRYGNTRRPQRGYYQKQNGRAQENKHVTENTQQNDEIDGKYNAKNKFGDYYRCHTCGSFRHMMNECPDKGSSPRNSTFVAENDPNDNYDKKPWPVLFTGNISVYSSQLVMEANNSAVLDSACSSTVCGKDWLDNYVKSLTPDKKEYVSVTESNETFRFGGGEVLPSEGVYTIPGTLGGNEVLIKTDVVDSHIPLLLSLSAMKSAKVVLYTHEDKAEVFGKSVNLNFTSCGHYCLPLIDNEATHVGSIQECMKVDISREDMVKNLTHLHRQFAHPSTEKLSDLLKNSNSWKSEYKTVLEHIYEQCQTCKKFKKGIRRPVVALPMARRFNQVLTMDLKKWSNFWIIYFIDSHSRLVVGKRILRKFPYEVVQAFMVGWLGAGYGIPEEIMFDNGGEFTGEEVTEMASVLNIKINTTASHSPFSNGLCEKNHSIVDNMLEKITYENPKMPFDDRLAWACTAKNAMAMFNGYSPYQIVFGRNPTLPGIDLHPPSTNEEIKGDMFLKHLQALNSAKKAFVEADSSERVRRALRHKIRISERSYLPGQSVYYKREDSSQWLGPAKVIVQDGKVVFLRHGSYIVRIYINRVVLQGEEYESENNASQDVTSEHISPNVDENVVKQHGRENVIQEPEVAEEENPTPMPIETQDNIPDVVYDFVPWRSIKVNDEIMFRQNDKDPWNSGKVLSRAGKASGNNASWFNVETNNDRLSVDLRKMSVIKLSDTDVYDELHNNEEPTEVLVVDLDNRVYNVKICAKTEQAKLDEIQKLKDFETFTVVEDMGQERISTRWVLTSKEDGRKKARLVARGFEELEKIQSDSPTISKSVMRMFLAICSTLQWKVKTTDIKSAFLQGQALDREVFIKPPRGFEDSKKLWKLKKCLYGLNDAARNFYLSVKSCLHQMGCKMSNLEPALFAYKTGEIIHGIILCHVDDFLHGGDERFHQDVIVPLEKEFQASRRASENFKYVGLNVSQNSDGIRVNQNHYLNSVEFEELPNRYTGPEVDLNPKEYTLFRSLVGSINWMANGTRPDISFAMINLSTKFNKAHTSHLKEAVKIVKLLKSEKFDITFPCLNGINDLKLVVYTDASLGNLNGVDSCGGHVVFLVDENRKCSTLAWHSGKIKRVVRSTIAAETMALSDGIEEAMYLREIIRFCIGGVLPVIAVTDNKSLALAIESTHLVQEKRLRIDISAIKEVVETQNVSVKWVPGVKQLADCMTKKGASPFDLMNTISGGVLPEF